MPAIDEGGSDGFLYKVVAVAVHSEMTDISTTHNHQAIIEARSCPTQTPFRPFTGYALQH